MSSLKLGKVNIEIVKDKIRLRWTYKGERFSLSVGDNTPEMLDIAKSKSYEISSEIYKGTFNFEKYLDIKPELKKPTSLDLLELWNIFLKAKLNSGLKEKTKSWFKGFDKIFKKLGKRLTFDSYTVKDELLAITTIEETKKALKLLSSCCMYGIKRRLIPDNPFYGVWQELPDREIEKPYCFSTDEINTIIKNFRIQADYYTDLVIFWIYTGCRPSEALGITWGDIAKDFSTVTFHGSPQRINGKGIVWSEGSKNYKKGNRKPHTLSRTIPLTQKITDALKIKAGKNYQPKNLIFPSQTGGFLDYGNFCHRQWKKCVRAIPGLEKTTPYNCRDTFITQQLLKGVPIAVIAAWCDNSPSMIQSRYADYMKLINIKPTDF